MNIKHRIGALERRPPPALPPVASMSTPAILAELRERRGLPPGVPDDAELAARIISERRREREGRR